MNKILVAEDELHLRKAIVKSLRDQNYIVIECSDGQQALESFYQEHIDLVITDVMMPYLDGNQLVTKIRLINQDIPILMLTALEAIDDKVKGFDSGTDDYLVKPVLMKELVIRVKALLRRYKINSEQQIKLPTAHLDYNSHTLKINQQEIKLTKKEFLLLFKLLANPGTIFSREQLLNEIWGYESDSFDRTIDTHIAWLREKADCPDFEIVTIRGLGYKVVIK
jgi:DNA-binding response OmpR family regulator